MEVITEFIGQVVLVGGGAAAIAYALVRSLGQKWIDQKFSQRLETFRREQNQMLEEAKYEINTRFNRVSKIHDKEFEVLSTAWKLLQDAYGEFIGITKPLQQYPDLNRLSGPALEGFLNEVELQDFQKDELRVASDKTRYYREKMYWIRVSNASKQLYKLSIHLRYNKIFLTSDIAERFTKLENAMAFAKAKLSTKAIEETDQDLLRRAHEPFDELRETAEPLMEQIENHVQERLHFDIS